MAEKYPIGIQDFGAIIRSKAVYVDKTAFVKKLAESTVKKTYFLSRPRRFGKSLFISTLEAFFQGKKELFEGLYIYDKVAWESYPIIRISMDATSFVKDGLELALQKKINDIAVSYRIKLQEDGLSRSFQELISKLHKKYKRGVVILIDEYDKPVIHGLEKFDTTKAEVNRDILKSFYSILKDSDPYIRFLFITGVAKFTKVSIFSDLNQLTDLTILNDFANICGYTEEEIKTNFPEGLAQLAQSEALSEEDCLVKIKDWYDGFSWNGRDFVYNPFSFVHLLQYRQFSNYWFESGTPTMLVRLLNKDFYVNFDDLIVNANRFNVYEFSKLDPITLMLQTGYLTLKKPIEDGFFEAGYSNREVRISFQEMLLGDYMNVHPGGSAVALLGIKRAFLENDIQKVMTLIDALFAAVPYQLFSVIDEENNEKSVNENFYHAIIFLTFKLLGVYIDAEVSHREGRIDAKVVTNSAIYLFEFKKNRSKEAAIKQMQEKNYAAQYALENKSIVLIGVSFTLAKRGISEWAIEKL